MTNREKFFKVFGFHALENDIHPCNNECPYFDGCYLDDGCAWATYWWGMEYKKPTEAADDPLHESDKGHI